MGNSSYKLHEACPDLDARYKRCQSLYFENVLTPVAAEAAKDGGALPPRPIYRSGVLVTDAADVAMARDALDPASINYACRDMWEDYKECVMGVMAAKQQDYLRRKAEKAGAKQASVSPAETPAAAPKQ